MESNEPKHELTHTNETFRDQYRICPPTPSSHFERIIHRYHKIEKQRQRKTITSHKNKHNPKPNPTRNQIQSKMTNTKIYNEYQQAPAASETDYTNEAFIDPRDIQPTNNNTTNNNHTTTPTTSPPPMTYDYGRVDEPIAVAPVPKYIHLGTRHPVTLNYCPCCGKQNVTTITRTKATGGTWAGVVVGLVVFWPLCFIPLVVKSMKQTNHHCPNCRAKVGRVKAYN